MTSHGIDDVDCDVTFTLRSMFGGDIGRSRCVAESAGVDAHESGATSAAVGDGCCDDVDVTLADGARVYFDGRPVDCWQVRCVSTAGDVGRERVTS